MPSTTSLVKVVGPRVLVLGSGGRLGRMLRKIWGQEAVSWASRRAGPGLISLDPLRDEHGMQQLAQSHDLVLCLAGVPAGRGMLDLNTELALAAVRAAAQTRCRTVFLCSSAAVYGPTDAPVGEGAERRPASRYGKEKARMEDACLTLGRSLGVRICNLRIGNIAGADAILGGWRPGFQLDRFADGTTPLRSVIGPHDLAEGLMHLINRFDVMPRFLNLALPTPCHMGDLLDRAGLPWLPRVAGPKAVAQAVLDVSALQRLVPLPAPEDSAGHVAADWKRFITHREAA